MFLSGLKRLSLGDAYSTHRRPDTFHFILTPAMVQILLFKSRIYGEKHLGVTKMSYLAKIFIKSFMADGRMHPSHTILCSK